MSTGLFTIALVVSAPGPTGLQKGDEFTFAGTVVENDYRLGQQLRREYELKVRTFILERQENWADAAVLTRLQQAQDAVGGVTKPITGNGPDKNAPPILQLDIVRIHTDGTIHLLVPSGPPFRLSIDTPARAALPIPLDKFAPSEFGLFPPRVPRSANPGETWKVAANSNLPDEVWGASKQDFINAEQCLDLLMNQKSADWDKPVGGQRAWHRADEVWVSTRDGVARKVCRVIQHREGISEVSDAWIKTEYVLKSHEKLDGQTYKRTRQDIEKAYSALTDASILGPIATKVGPRIFEEKLTNLDGYLSETAPGTPYREAIIAARRTLDAARRGEAAPTLSSALQGAALIKWPEAGQSAPNLRFGNNQLSDQRGKPIVLVFFKPANETTDLSLAIADALQKRYGDKVLVIPLVVFGELTAAIQDRDRLKLAIPIYDGTLSVSTYGVETVPRFAVIDSNGKVKWTFTGVGAETGFLVREQVDRLASPILPNTPHGITPAPGTTTSPAMPRP